MALLRSERDEPATVIKYFAVGTGIYAAVLLGIVILVALTKSSCPFFYVDDGTRTLLVGEAYSGAAFRSIARDDLLPTPLPGGQSIRARLANEAHETQYTDLLELVTADHAPDLRVLSTFDARLIGAGPARPPISARDGDGHDVTAALRADDGRWWETDLAEVSTRPAPPDRESLDLVFEADVRASPVSAPVLELVLGNTPWIDAVMGRFFALMGGELSSYLGKGNAPEAGDKIRRWREREGLDLRVEAEVDGAFRPVAVVPTVGPMALRRVAVPLPLAAGTVPGRRTRCVCV